jgi:hypothetical protein
MLLLIVALRKLWGLAPLGTVNLADSERSAHAILSLTGAALH